MICRTLAPLVDALIHTDTEKMPFVTALDEFILPFSQPATDTAYPNVLPARPLMHL